MENLKERWGTNDTLDLLRFQPAGVGFMASAQAQGLYFAYWHDYAGLSRLYDLHQLDHIKVLYLIPFCR